MPLPDYANMLPVVFDRIDGAQILKDWRDANDALDAALAKPGGQIDLAEVEAALHDVQAMGAALSRRYRRR